MATFDERERVGEDGTARDLADRGLPASIRSFMKLRHETIVLAEHAPEERLNDIPAGRAASLRWLIGHVLVVWDHGLFPKVGDSWRLPPHYHTLFPEGSSPGNWTVMPPSLDELLRRLRIQKDDILDATERHLDYPLAEPFLDFATVGEAFDYLAGEERRCLNEMRAVVAAFDVPLQ
ncbi:DinB family protein [Paenibacillus sp. LHD-117]|uniref:DinB family protein n=1 Tax=Paenibacillus sp. LHD-117 TaxID=3071412 RepID=UPI0027E1AC39|nr:DinB family protein [Paenibacillus sp. LHD-117]MDQ6422696.1 DinB family protein [Paenibacillus sp. LHD-117]